MRESCHSIAKLHWFGALFLGIFLHCISQNASDSVCEMLAELGLPVLGVACRESWPCCAAGAGALGTSISRWHQGCSPEGGGRSVRGEPKIRSSWFSVRPDWVAIYNFLFLFFPPEKSPVTFSSLVAALICRTMLSTLRSLKKLIFIFLLGDPLPLSFGKPRPFPWSWLRHRPVKTCVCTTRGDIKLQTWEVGAAEGRRHWALPTTCQSLLGMQLCSQTGQRTWHRLHQVFELPLRETTPVWI